MGDGAGKEEQVHTRPFKVTLRKLARMGWFLQ